jgi:hypothetical protein
VFHRLARPLLGDFLGDSFLMHAAVRLCPGDLTRVLALPEEGCIFRAVKSKYLYWNSDLDNADGAER